MMTLSFSRSVLVTSPKPGMRMLRHLLPGADLQQLRQLRRNALKEQDTNKPPKNFRAIFQVLQELDQHGTSNATE